MVDIIIRWVWGTNWKMVMWENCLNLYALYKLRASNLLDTCLTQPTYSTNFQVAEVSEHYTAQPQKKKY